MLRFEGEVFLLGTAIPAPAQLTTKIATIFAHSRQETQTAAAGSSRTVAPIAKGAQSASRSGD
jgi:hypothetical protein